MVEVTKRLNLKEKESDNELLVVLAYGVSGGSVEKELESITGVNPESEAIHTKETGHVMVMPDLVVQVPYRMLISRWYHVWSKLQVLHKLE